jgi:hypothetical protein
MTTTTKTLAWEQKEEVGVQLSLLGHFPKIALVPNEPHMATPASSAMVFRLPMTGRHPGGRRRNNIKADGFPAHRTTVPYFPLMPGDSTGRSIDEAQEGEGNWHPVNTYPAL